MNTSAIVMMIISMVFLWGGLALSILHLMKNPEELDDNFEDEFLDELYNFVAKDLYDGQFTAEEFEDGLDVHRVMSVAMENMKILWKVEYALILPKARKNKQIAGQINTLKEANVPSNSSTIPM